MALAGKEMERAGGRGTKKSGVEERWLLGFIVVVAGCFGFLLMEEAVEVGWLGNTAEYPFGGEGDVPWYYKSASLYASVQLVAAAIFLVCLAMGVVAFVQNRKQRLLLCAVATGIWLLIQLFIGQTG